MMLQLREDTGATFSRWNTTVRSSASTLVVAEEAAFSDHWTEDQLRFLAKHYPAGLIQLLENDELPDHLLTFAAEAAGDVSPSWYPQASRVLTRLLRHPRAYVREGAVYGLTTLSTAVPALLENLRRLATADEPSEGVRLAAQEALDFRAS